MGPSSLCINASLFSFPCTFFSSFSSIPSLVLSRYQDPYPVIANLVHKKNVLFVGWRVPLRVFLNRGLATGRLREGGRSTRNKRKFSQLELLKRVICQTCGKYNWEGCGLHIAEALAGLRMDQICRCDDDYDSEHPFTLPTEPTSTLTLQTAASGTPTAATFATPSSTGSGTDLSTPVASTSASSSPFPPVQVPDHPCELPVPASSSDPLTPEAEIQYRLSKISSKSAELAAIRHAQQQAALKELQRIQEQQQAKLKQANETAFNRLLGGLKDAVGETEDALSNK